MFFFLRRKVLTCSSCVSALRHLKGGNPQLPPVMLSPRGFKVIPEMRCGEVNGGFYMLHCNTRTRHSGTWSLPNRWILILLRSMSTQVGWVRGANVFSLPFRQFWQQVLREEEAHCSKIKESDTFRPLSHCTPSSCKVCQDPCCVSRFFSMFSIFLRLSQRWMAFLHTPSKPEGFFLGVSITTSTKNSQLPTPKNRKKTGSVPFESWASTSFGHFPTTRGLWSPMGWKLIQATTMGWWGNDGCW